MQGVGSLMKSILVHYDKSGQISQLTAEVAQQSCCWHVVILINFLCCCKIVLMVINAVIVRL